MQKHHGSTVIILGLVAAVAIGTLHLLQTRYPHQETQVTVERTGLADVEDVFGASAKAPAPATGASTGLTNASEGYAFDDSSNTAADDSAAALEGYEDAGSGDYGSSDYSSTADSSSEYGGGDYAIEDGPYADYAAAAESADPYGADADPYDGSVAPAADSYDDYSSEAESSSSDDGYAYADDSSRYDEVEADEETAAPVSKPAPKAEPKPETKPAPIQRTANPDARDYGYSESSASSSSTASSKRTSSASTAAAAPQRSHVEPIPKPKGEAPPNADAVYQWWPDARRVPTGQFTLIYAGQPQNRQAIALLFSRVPDPAAASQHIRVLDTNGEAVSGTWVAASNPRMIQLGGLKRGRYTIVVKQGMTDTTQRAMAQTLTGPVYVN